MFRLLSSVTMEAMYSMTSPRITTYILKVYSESTTYMHVYDEEEKEDCLIYFIVILLYFFIITIEYNVNALRSNLTTIIKLMQKSHY